jgi:hypothetical protein
VARQQQQQEQREQREHRRHQRRQQLLQKQQLRQQQQQEQRCRRPQTHASNMPAARVALLSSAGISTARGGARTTVLLRNVPGAYTRSMVMDLLDSEGFARRYDFVYAPHSLKTGEGLGFAFVNLARPEDADALRQHLSGFTRWVVASTNVLSVGWSGADQQGLAANVERYRNSSIMHGAVPEDWKPLMLVEGIPVRFPPSTRKVSAPELPACWRRSRELPCAHTASAEVAVGRRNSRLVLKDAEATTGASCSGSHFSRPCDKESMPPHFCSV